MEQHEREFFIAQIRLGIIKLNDNIEIKPLTIEQELESNNIYQKAYQDALNCDIMTSDELDRWIYDAGLWDANDDARIKILEKNIESYKVKIYESRKQKKEVLILKHELKKTKEELLDKLNTKNKYFHTTCEGLSESAKINWIITNTTYKDKTLYDFDSYSIEYIISQYYKSFLTEEQIRELVINDPWRTIWNIRENSKLILFKNLDTYELTHNQKHIIVWSQIYDNLNESMEPPEESVVKDHDMLDGWFIIQSQKRKKEQAEKDITKNKKMKNSSEIFIIGNTKEEREEIHHMNDIEGKNIKKQRSQLIQQKGLVEQHEFADERIDQTRKQLNMFKDKFRRS